MQQAEAEGQPTARALKASRILNNLQTARSAEAGGPRRFDPWVRGVWLVNKRVTHFVGGGGGGGRGGEKWAGWGARLPWGEGGADRRRSVAGRRGDQSIEPSRLRGAASLPLLASTTVAEAASR